MILLYKKEAVSCTLWILSASVSYVAAISAETTIYKLAIWFFIQLVMFIISFLFENFRFVRNFATWIYLPKPTPKIVKTYENK